VTPDVVQLMGNQRNRHVTRGGSADEEQMKHRMTKTKEKKKASYSLRLFGIWIFVSINTNIFAFY
jgi:hypothetical protein